MRAEAMGEDGALSDWDRFASVEYLRLAVEDEPEDTMQVDAADDVWGAAAAAQQQQAAAAAAVAGAADRARAAAAEGGEAGGATAMDTSGGR